MTGAAAGGAPGGALLVAGTASDAGKSVLTAGLCRWLAREGVRVAPFKAQNMALNSVVTADGAEIGRAQAMQAAAAGIEPEAAMNPVLLKPGSDRHSQLIVLGRPVAEVDALGYRPHKGHLLGIVLDCLADLRRRFDVVICEGAGSPTEINLRASDIANLGLARAAGLPVLVVGDIDRGGVFAALFGTLALLDRADQAHVAGWVINRFRGDPRLLEPGLRQLEGLTGRPVLGVVPWLPGLWLDAEDSLDLRSHPEPEAEHAWAAGRTGPVDTGPERLRVAVIRFPRLSNVTDLDALRAEPGVSVRLATTVDDLSDVDLVVLPGTRATVSDLAWLRRRGLAEAVVARAAAGLPVLGICGGYQMLGARIDDDVESGAGEVPGLGLLPVTTRFAADKVLGRRAGVTADGHPVTGYEIRHGRPVIGDAPGPGVRGLTTGCGDGSAGVEPFAADGVRRGGVAGTSWHGLLENDEFRRSYLAAVAAAAGRSFRPARTSFAAVRQRRLDALGDLVADHLDLPAVRALLERGAPAGLPFVPPGAP
ncbi:adenosylcobyric acid synthase (glutamine-hydrolysing) [Frankia sp. EI5c]|uniref:cobyric acid synthase n=1 Tax=Frankia sp. EI5c TaxID=683316 RepID=UPI0007C2FF95|nr:cobyric acid synthase [Frankia sp. EI5c]OAA28494.1 adenosylcobyric acid synthase (glutamine-hydrolysing) [Frankia sp. EI5c]